MNGTVLKRWGSFGFALFFTLLFFSVFVCTGENRLLLAGCVLLGLLLLWGVWLLCDRLTRYFVPILVGAVLFLLAVQIPVGLSLRYDPIFDLEAIYRGAIEWVERGSFTHYRSSTCHSDYFAIFPNNLGGLSLLALIFKLGSLLGFTDYFAMATVANALLSAIAMVLTVLTARELFSQKAALFTLALFLLFPPFYAMAPVFYTDCLSLLFPILAFYLYLKAKRTEELLTKSLLTFGVGLVIGLGFLIKATVGIALIAMVIDLFCTDWRRGVRFSLCTLLTAVVISTVFHAAIYGNMLDKTLVEQKSMPLSYWTALAFQGDGQYNQVDFELAWQTDPSKRSQVMADLTRDRIRELGVGGMAELFLLKGATLMGSGTLALSDYLDDRPQTESVLHSFLLYNGEHYPLYRLLCTGFLLAVWVAAILGGFCRTRGFVPRLCLVGLFLFLFIWESNGRMLLNLLPMLFLSAPAGGAILSRNGGTP